MRLSVIGLWWAVILAVTVAVATTSARAEMQVLESNVTAYPAESRLPDDTQFKLQAGERVKVLLLPSNQTKVFEGPRTRTPGTPGGARGPSKKKAD